MVFPVLDITASLPFRVGLREIKFAFPGLCSRNIRAVSCSNLLRFHVDTKVEIFSDATTGVLNMLPSNTQPPAHRRNQLCFTRSKVASPSGERSAMSQNWDALVTLSPSDETEKMCPPPLTSFSPSLAPCT